MSNRHSATVLTICTSLLFLFVESAFAADPPPPPPIVPPTQATKAGDVVKNLVTGNNETVIDLILDPPAAPGSPQLAFVRTSAGNVILVKNSPGDIIYNNDSPPLAFTVVSSNATNKTVQLRNSGGNIAPFSFAPTNAVFQAEFNSSGTPGMATPPVTVSAADGVKVVRTGTAGSNGRVGVFFVPPSKGGDGAVPADVDFTNTTNVTATTKYGIEAGSVGGAGGTGGGSYFNIWEGRDGGNGASGGVVDVTNAGGITVSASGADQHGIFAYSKSGKAGDGGTGFAAPGGGTGGHSSDGGSVEVTNNGTVTTSGTGAFGIYGQSVSNNGGDGGDQWGLVGKSGSGGFGGNGGMVEITNSTTGIISTTGIFGHGIFSQSVGGSGGSSGTSGNLLLSLIGDADNGGNGGVVKVTNQGLITTAGDDSKGIFAQSVGGGGGSGGSAGGLIAIGGAGSNGGSAGAVTVDNEATGTITTTGARSDGIFAQSTGGSGGAGSGAGGLVSIGGKGSKAGNGADVTVSNLGTVSTSGNNSRGIVAQSIGGGGGDGGSSGGMVAVGGNGAGGGTSGQVTLTNGGDISTKGENATGIFAQSVGGGGGNGGSAGSVSAFVGVAVGGTGGGGGAGGKVNLTFQGKDVTNASTIKTEKDRSVGVFAQSVGGGGGTGGGAVSVTGGIGGAASIAIGGKGGKGGAGGVVTLSKGTGMSHVETGGDDSTGVFLQSVGGGGGNGGYSVAVAVSGGPVSGSLSVAVGGSGDTGGMGGTVTVGSFNSTGTLTGTGFNGDITTTGDRSSGFVAQSVGGGGGNGGVAVSAAGSGALLISGSVGIGLGGSGAGGGSGGKVSVGTEGDITTEGENSAGMLVQSVGGGGGNGGGSVVAALSGAGAGAGTVNVGLGGSGGMASEGGDVVAATASGTVTTKGKNSTGIVVQSIGGGGGNGGYSVSAGGAGAGVGAGAVSVGLGGKAGGGGNGGTVKADLKSDVATLEMNSTGILVQSVGGGGGNGGLNVSAAGSGAGVGSGAVGIGLGGAGGDGGLGGNVTATSTGAITTEKDSSSGMVVQSIGGGGGNGGFNISGSGSGAGVGSGGVTVGLGGGGGSGNHGGIVAATSSGTITTKGASSVGVIAQSVGGGGGNGGFNVSATGSGAGVGSGTVGVGLGGSGGSAGDGGAVTLTVNKKVATFGNISGGVVAQSVGGGGGNGGLNVSASGSGAGVGSGAVTVGLGGTGAGGGKGETVLATIGDDVETKGFQSDGILVQSIGGGGGNGGANINVSGSGAGVGSGAVSVAIGAKGGSGGMSSSATLTSTGDVKTEGRESRGVVVQSIGGGGGNGGLTINGSGSGAGVGSGAISVDVGGSGGDGGASGKVVSNVTGDISTDGKNSDGFIAQSLGGGGGNGALNVSLSGSGAGVGSGSISVGIGSSGGDGGDANQVDADFNGTLITKGDYSVGFMAQAVGGGGGNAGGTISAAGSGAGVGSGTVTVGVGGSGGAAGDGGLTGVDLAVEANAAGSIDTTGNFSGGFIAQSIGGGGGNGGYSITANGSGAGVGSGAIGVGLGGGGAKGGIGKDVISRVTGSIITRGHDSIGMLTQSVGGGGGNGGFSITATGSGAGTGSGSVAVGLGGGGDIGGKAGKVDASTTKAITTIGDRSSAFVAQSIGGGGGNGGFNVTATGSGAGTGSGAIAVGLGGKGKGGGNGGAVIASTGGKIQTSGVSSTGILAQSVGGGGGNGGFSVAVSGSGAGTGSGAVSVGLGGSGAGGGDGSTVDLTVTNDVDTKKKDSTGVIAQSIGGGGGTGGFSVSVTGSGAGTGSGVVGVGLGGTGGGGGDSDRVTSTMTGDISTEGENSSGLLVQSVGGGGGNGGFNVTVGFSGAGTGSGAASVGIGGSGGSGGKSGVVTSTLTGDVTTLGKQSSGVIAQSVAGGGGNGAFAVSGAVSVAGTAGGSASVGVGGSGGGGGDSAKVTNTVTGDVMTSGEGSMGILAQSVGGGGGNGGTAITGSLSLGKSASGAVVVGVAGSGDVGGKSADVSNTVTGYTQTAGIDSDGVVSQSIGGGGGNGGVNVSLGLSASNTGSGALVVGVGGGGGAGGDGAKATSSVTGGVVTMSDSSVGILTQSLGGGGGNGGTNVTAAISLSKESGGTLGVGVGGFGGAGGNAGEVSSTVVTTATHKQIGTMGKDSSAVIAQSIGGGGGNGGVNATANVNLTGKSGAALGVGVGGFGGGAGDGGKVTLDVTGEIVTMGDNSTGLLAQSVGGGGGNGGTNLTGSLSLSKGMGSSTTVAASIGIGGFGGGGGDAGNVDLDFNGSIQALPTTVVEGSDGLVAQSIGGGGGNGAVNVSGAVSYAAKDADGHALVVGVGGFGGTGGNAGNVEVDVIGGESIKAKGDGRSAILASSVGGGGGRGGLNVSAGITSDAPIIVGVGGMGGNGGTAGNVTVNAVTDLMASGSDKDKANSGGLVAQSIGGGGGDGGLNVSGGLSLSKDSKVPSITFGIGGFGGTGAMSGNVSATHTGVIDSSGRWTHGIFAQSIAGGGGNGALNISGNLNFSDSESSAADKDISIVAGLGGHGGKGADSGNTSVTSSGNITTSGDFSRGIFAQSVGGGGGTGGMNVTAIFAKNTSPITMGVGGFGAGGGHAGNVSVNRGTAAAAAGKITTDGMGAIGLESSSIGGGGGDAGMNFVVGFSKRDNSSTNGAPGAARPKPKHTGVDDKVLINFDKVLDELEGRSKPASTNKDQSGFAAQIAVGGAGGDAGNGGTSTVMHFGDIETKKDHSRGILAQSIGGGGGNATLNLGLSVQDPSNKKNQKGLKIAVGGQPGEGGNGGKVDVTHKGKVETLGNNSTGILAQSVGGGGGNVGSDYALSKNAEGGEIGITIGRKGGTGGKGDDVKLDSDGEVITRGDTSYGLLAQSIGNGGGNSSTTAVGFSDLSEKAPSTNIAVGLEGGMGGTAGNVDLDAAGLVMTEGEDSHAIFGQSIGGGGGNGGSVSKNFYTATTAELTVGGKGGTGGTGGNVDVDSSARVSTKKRNSIGILAQSVGGGGGTGGEVEAGGVQGDGSTASIAIGGGGGTGMTSGQIDVDNSGIITTEGEDSHGVLAQSIGGGGGNASSVINGIINTDEGKTAQVSISVGGSGGMGAESGKVTANNTGSIGTMKKNSIGMFAQSIGGGGGNAGKVMSGIITSKGSGTAITLGIGGNGGMGGTSGPVFVTNKIGSAAGSGQIITMGDSSHGIFANSIGGGGGMGSTVLTANSAVTGTAASKTKSVAFSLGGDGGTGGTGGAVDVDNDGLIRTFGKQAHGILAQSVGGGGGNGGVAVAGDLSMGGTAAQGSASKKSTISIGGKGGSGNDGGKVIVDNSGTIEVNGNESSGIYAQSVGGGGGNGGFSTNLSRNVLTNPRTNLVGTLLNIGVGGARGAGGDGGDVDVINTGSITVNGDNAYGIYAQSVGGGGGNVGTSISNPIWMATDLAISAISGGLDGADGKAGKVNVNTTGNISTTGKNSKAYSAQAVSGGGGNVNLFVDVSKKAVALNGVGAELPPNDGFADPKGAIVSFLKLGAEKVIDQFVGLLEATHEGTLSTLKDQSVASQTQSVGGGGGSTTSNLMVDDEATVAVNSSLGGTDVSNSSGGNIEQNRAGNINTLGRQSQGSSVQSIGGGGGRLVSNVEKVSTASAAAPAPAQSPLAAPLAVPIAAPAPFAAPAPAPLATSTTLGGDANVGNNGGNLNLIFAGDTVTAGDFSPGMVIQSIGAGGGESHIAGFDTLEVNIGATNASIGNGGNISLTNTGALSTSGTLSDGIVLQSIGGGGGFVLSDTDESGITVNRRAGNTGNGGAIDFTQVGDVVVLDDRTVGVLAQSLGGGGGVVNRLFMDTAGGVGSGGTVDLTLNGSVHANGNQGVGVFAQSRGASGAGDISVTLRQGEMLTFGSNGIGVHLSGGNDNTVTLNGSLAGVDGLLGNGILGTEGNDTIENHAAFMGQFDLGTGTNGFVNHGGATLIAGPRLSLGNSPNMLTQNGTLATGGLNNVQRSALMGSFRQSAGARTIGEIDFGAAKRGQIDGVDATGRVELAGSYELSILNPERIPSGKFEAVLFHGDGGVVNQGLSLVTAPSVVVTYELLYPNGIDAILGYEVDFAPRTVGRNLQEVGNYLNRIQAAGSSPALDDVIIKLLFDPDVETYAESLSQMSPDFYAELQSEFIRKSQRFGRTLIDGGTYHRLEEDRYLWFRYNRESKEHDGYDDYKRAFHNYDGYAVGLEQDFGGGWSGSFAGSFEDSLSSGYEGRWRGESSSQQIGMSLKRSWGATRFGASFAYGWDDADVTRFGNLIGPFQTSLSREMNTLGALVHFSQEFDSGGNYLRPAVDFGATRLMANSAMESGAGPINLQLADYDEAHVWIQPGITAGRRGYVPFVENLRMHLFSELSVHEYLSSPYTDVIAGLQGDSTGSALIRVPVELGQSELRATLGIEFTTPNNVSFGFNYTKSESEHNEVDQWGGSLRIPF